MQILGAIAYFFLLVCIKIRGLIMENLKLAGIIFLLTMVTLGVFSCTQSALASPRVALPADISVENPQDRLPVVIATAFAGLLVYANENGAFNVSPKQTPRPQIKKDSIMAVIEWKFD